MSDFKRFVSYIYVYRNGKKEKNSGFAKVELRNEMLKINVQLKETENGSKGLDVYGFVRKGEKQAGVFLGSMEPEKNPWFRLETKNHQLGGTRYRLEDFSGLWVKGVQGENHITIWDEEPVKTMELESELLEKQESFVQDPEKIQEVSQEPEPEEIQEVTWEEEPGEMQEVSHRENEMEEQVVQQPGQYGIWNVVLEEPLDGGGGEKNLNGVRAQESADLAGRIKPMERPLSENERRWELLLDRYRSMESLLKDGEAECIRMTPRELSMFRGKNWDPCRNHFILHGYYCFRHLLFGRSSDGVCFLGVPGMFSQREQKTAQAFGFPCFREAKEEKRGGCFGYWCRPVE